MRGRWWIFVLLIYGFLYAQQDFSEVTIKSTHVRGNVYMLEGAGGNIGVSVGPDGILIVDDQFAPLADKIRNTLRTIGGGKLRFILNTHWHHDHTDGNKVFSSEAPVIAHTNVHNRLMNGVQRPDRFISPLPKEAWPVITFDASLSIHFNDEEIKAIHFPHGHTDGDVVVLFEKFRVAHLGDIFFSGRFPFVDLATGGDVKGLIHNIEEIIHLLPEDVRIIPGHGPLSTIEDFKAYHDMLKETVNIVQRRINSGKSLDKIKKEGLPSRWKSWSWQFIPTEQWLEIVYNSLTGKAAMK